MRAVQAIQQLPNLVGDINALISGHRDLGAAHKANHGLIHEVQSENNDLHSQVLSKDKTIQELQVHVHDLRKDVAVKGNALKDSSKDTAKLKAKLTEQVAKVEALNKAKESLTKEKTGLEAKVAQQAAELAKVKATLGQLQAQHDAKLGAVQSQLDTLNSYAVPIPDNDLSLDEL